MPAATIPSSPGPSDRGPSDPGRSESAELLRFDRGERVLHWANAVLFGFVMATAAALYVPPISAVIGRREIVKTIHVYAGIALPFPILATVLGGRWGAAFRADVRRLNRWSDADRAWIRAGGRSGSGRLGKFNPGQKLNAAFTAGAIIVMLATGSIMRWPGWWPVAYRTGATFVHDWVFIALVVTITGHIIFAVNDPESLASMRTGRIGTGWARRHAPRWLDEHQGKVRD
ncbi:MAG: formate dehydrogenase subunit gamma [Acidimicrobiales bacterium]